MRWVVAALLRVLVLGLGWLALAGWDADYALYGAVGVACATALGLVLSPPDEPRIREWPRRLWSTVVLAGWFLGQSLAGGVDVALRAVRRPVDIEPAVVEAPMRLPAGPARQLAVLLMNLMPGSMVQRVHPDEAATGPVRAVELHTLSPELDPAAQWERLQERVAAAFGARRW